MFTAIRVRVYSPAGGRYEPMRFHSLIDNCLDELIALEETLCRIPAPSHQEAQRAAFIRDWLSEYGPVHVDGAGNVVFTGFDDGGRDALLICAHTDTVFPDLTPFEPVIRDGRLWCPGAGDDTANLAGMLLLIRYLALSGAKPRRPVIFAANSCEEGLGNLLGSRELVQTYQDRLGAFLSLDGYYFALVNQAVGSHRYRVTVRTPGGHSYAAFGRQNAIAVLAELITELYRVEAPVKAKTTFNVGVIEGGTSVNTIAQEASMLYEYRSEDRECLEYMKACFEHAVDACRAKPDTEVSVAVVGIRPCSGAVDPERQKNLEEEIRAAIRSVTGAVRIPAGAGSTD